MWTRLLYLLVAAPVLLAQGDAVVNFVEFPDLRIEISPVSDRDFDKVAAELGSDAAELSSKSFFVTNNTGRNIIALRVLWSFWNADATRRAVWVSTYDRLGYDTFSSGFHIDDADRRNQITYQSFDMASRSTASVFAAKQRWLMVPGAKSFIARPYVRPTVPRPITAMNMFRDGLLRPPLVVSRVDVKLDCVILDDGEIIGADDEDLAGELAVRKLVASEVVDTVESRLALGHPASAIASELLREPVPVPSRRGYYTNHFATELSVLANKSASDFATHLGRLKDLPDLPRFYRAACTTQSRTTCQTIPIPLDVSSQRQ